MTFKDFKNKYQKKEIEEFPNVVTKSPLVSVCVQTFNQASFISRCIDNILNQDTSFDFEILLGEDSSTDGTREICIEYAKKYPEKIRLFLHKRENNIKVDGKPTGLFNSLHNLYIANGKYLAYCDGDDYWHDKTKLQKQVNFLENNPEYVISYHKAIFINSDGHQIDDQGYPKLSQRDFSSKELKEAIVQPIISTWCFKKVITNIPDEFTGTIISDNFWISLLGFHGKGKYLSNIKPSRYRIHRKGIWSLLSKDSKNTSKMISYGNMSMYYKARKEFELAYYYKKRSWNHLKMLVFFYIKKMQILKLRQAIKLYRDIYI